MTSSAWFIAAARLIVMTSACCAVSMTSSLTPVDSPTSGNSSSRDGGRQRREATSRKLIVTTILEEPYMMMKERGAFLAGNQRFEGYLADILQRLATSVGFQYETRLSRDGKYGELGPDGVWNGMIGEVQSGESDIAAGALIVTDTLRQYVNFTEPFLSMRWSALLRRPSHDPNAVHPSNRRQPSSFSGTSSKRVTTASQLLRSDIPCGVVENSVAHQMLATSFDPVAQALYRRMTSLSLSATSHRGGGGGGGSSSSDPFVRSVQEGVDRARRERYAFILDSPTAEYVASREPCDLYTTEPFLDVATYAFAIRKRGPLSGTAASSSSKGGDESRQLRLEIDREMRRMKQSGEMQSMYLRWWRDECGSSFPIDDDDQSEVAVPVAVGGGFGRRNQLSETATTNSGDVSRRHTRLSSSSWRLADTHRATRWTLAAFSVVTATVIATASDVLTFSRVATAYNQ